MRAAAVARVSPSSRPAAARPAHLRAIARRTTGPNGESGGRASGGLARVGGPTRVVCLARASSRDEGGVGSSGDDASSNARAWVAETRVERGSNAALSVDGMTRKTATMSGARRRALAFDVDDATSAWVLCRFAFISGRVRVRRGSRVRAARGHARDGPPSENARPRRCWPRRRESSSRQAPAGRRTRADATPRRRCFRSAENVPVPFAALWNTHDVALGRGVRARWPPSPRAPRAESRGLSAGDETAAASRRRRYTAALRVDSRRRHRARRRRHRVRARRARGAEELFFRGFLAARLFAKRARERGNEKKGNEPAAVAVARATFAAAHFSPSDFPALFVAGAVFGAASLGSRTRGLIAPFLAHATFNALVRWSHVL